MSKQYQFKLVLLGNSNDQYVRILLIKPVIQANLQWGNQGVLSLLDMAGPVLTTLIYNSLVLRFVKDQFDDYRESTIGGTYRV